MDRSHHMRINLHLALSPRPAQRQFWNYLSGIVEPRSCKVLELCMMLISVSSGKRVQTWGGLKVQSPVLYLYSPQSCNYSVFYPLSTVSTSVLYLLSTISSQYYVHFSAVSFHYCDPFSIVPTQYFIYSVLCSLQYCIYSVLCLTQYCVHFCTEGTLVHVIIVWAGLSLLPHSLSFAKNLQITFIYQRAEVQQSNTLFFSPN